MTIPFVDTNWPAPVEPPPVAFATAPTLDEQVAALCARWLIGPNRDEHSGAFYADLREAAERLVALNGDTAEARRREAVLALVLADVTTHGY